VCRNVKCGCEAEQNNYPRTCHSFPALRIELQTLLAQNSALAGVDKFRKSIKHVFVISCSLDLRINVTE
jgi:hypothetical protein